jgi:Pyruvate/2-oxoacid:ferredoxin oxidoreductase gamma subunit
MAPTEAEAWVREKMVPVFPLGVKKDVPDASWGAWRTPRFDAESLLAAAGARTAEVPRHARGFPRAFGDEIGLKLAGAGGDGAQTAALLLARAAVSEGFDATHIPSYGPESRGGTSYADVRMAEGEVLCPDVPEPNVLVAFNRPSLAKFGPAVARGGVALWDASVVQEPPPLGPDVRGVAVPCSEIAHALGMPVAKNVVALGALQAATGIFPPETYLAAIRHALHGKEKLVATNEEAFRRGMRAAAGASV